MTPWRDEGARDPRAGATVCVAASPGGHIAELQAVQEAFAGFRRVWITGRSRQADALEAAGERVSVLPSWGRDAPGLRGLPANLRASLALLREHRPLAVVTNGAGLVVPLALMARLSGARLVFIETMARVTDSSLTGRILAPLAHTVLVQWPEMRRLHRRAVVCRPALLEAARSSRAGGEGTFVSVGTRPEPFDRLLAIVDRAVEAGHLPRPVTAQSGSSSYRPASYRATAWMKPERIERAIDAARYVVCHGGSGMIAASIAAGHRPLVLARRKAAGEHRTEHQQQIVDKLAASGAIVPVDGEIGAPQVRRAGERFSADSARYPGPSLAGAMREALGAAIGRPREG